MRQHTLDGRVAVVTAAGRGIGRGIAEALGAAGARVVVNSYGAETTAATAEAIRAAGGEAIAVAGDVTDPAMMLALAEQAISAFGQIDVLVNNVGAGPKDGINPEDGPLGGTAALWDAMYRQNLRPVVLMSEAVLPHMTARRQGRIINISSIAGRAALPGPLLKTLVPPAYGAMKAALISYTQCLAQTAGEHNITVNAICPGIVLTDAWRQNAKAAVAMIPEFKGQDPDEWFEGVCRGDYPQYFDATPMGRPQTVEDIGNAAVFLASDNAMNMTGQSLMVDGGMIKI
jgi:meso-butanediol dehydrogenase/(S,S)-butanediol dehydrogenase/diacetyl reductase